MLNSPGKSQGEWEHHITVNVPQSVQTFATNTYGLELEEIHQVAYARYEPCELVAYLIFAGDIETLLLALGNEPLVIFEGKWEVDAFLEFCRQLVEPGREHRSFSDEEIADLIQNFQLKDNVLAVEKIIELAYTKHGYYVRGDELSAGPSVFETYMYLQSDLAAYLVVHEKNETVILTRASAMLAIFEDKSELACLFNLCTQLVPRDEKL